MSRQNMIPIIWWLVLSGQRTDVDTIVCVRLNKPVRKHMRPTIGLYHRGEFAVCLKLTRNPMNGVCLRDQLT